MVIEQPTFHSVWWFSMAAEDFKCVGVSTNKTEADALLAEYRTKAGKTCGAVISETFPEFEERLLKSRLGAMAEILLRLEKALPPASEQAVAVG